MKLIKNNNNRKSIRLKNYDYSQAGFYYVTICTHHRMHLFGNAMNEGMTLNDAGKVADQCWKDIPGHFPNVQLDEYIVMPNHIHGILWITNPVGAKNFSPLHRPCGTSKTIGSMIRGFKIGVTKWFRKNTRINNIWQRGYYEHVVRDESDLKRIREYIVNNVKQWKFDKYYEEK